MSQFETVIEDFLRAHCPEVKRVVFLTGAGISAESGIPTFRGEEGYWTVGSKVYQPQEMATWQNFQAMPAEVWRWYLHRRSICHAAKPNPAHLALAELEKQFQDDFTLVTQNVDGLHLRAGNSFPRTYQIHGNIDYMRPYEGDSTTLRPIGLKAEETHFKSMNHQEILQALGCEADEEPMRPHVLWFDECYDEDLYRFESSLRATVQASLVVIVGTSGATNLPNQMVACALQNGIPLIDINPVANVFGQAAAQSSFGLSLQGKAGAVLPPLAKALIAQHKG